MTQGLSLTAGGIATLACLLEVSAPKPGNVHRGADFEDVTFHDFATSAVVLGQTIDQSESQGLGQLILDSVSQTQMAVRSNTNLGMVLLIGPLAQLVRGDASVVLDSKKVKALLCESDLEDGSRVFEAIRLANPGGLGEVPEMDVRKEFGQPSLLDAMALASERDSVAKQYTNGFADIFCFGIPALRKGLAHFGNLIDAIVYSHVAWMAEEADSLIVRKCGQDVADHAQMLAQKAIVEIDSEASDQEAYYRCVAELDFWSRSDGHRRNPGTTADLIAATLFVAIQNRVIQPPYK